MYPPEHVMDARLRADTPSPTRWVARVRGVLGALFRLAAADLAYARAALARAAVAGAVGALCALAAFAGVLVLAAAGLVALGLHLLAAVAILVVVLVVIALVAFRSAERWMRETRLEATQRQLDAVLHDDPRVHASPERPDVP